MVEFLSAVLWPIMAVKYCVTCFYVVESIHSSVKISFHKDE